MPIHAAEVEAMGRSLLDLAMRLRREAAGTGEGDTGAGDTVASGPAPPPAGPPETNPALLRHAVIRLQAMRQRRLHNFGLALAGETAWDILLALYQALLAGRDLTFAQLCKESGAYPATIRRWLSVLAGLDLIDLPEAGSDPALLRARLTHKGELAMADCILGLLAEGGADPAEPLPA
ncbi:hypothetical protein H7F50_05750 [Novosphingobium flavum]|uniref:hypothetical protein n=1 Tax=Novosphingobium aerophilum TaxID=2839843 RepID=UPI001639E851|nr:hypothetical protein [Novosphingobium aerophilum]MBC2661252.1 hypothetical protein [Novosphingobium aerophilum]